MASSLPAFPPFEVHAETSSTAVRWKKWLRRFENMATCLNIKDDMKRKRAMLLHYGGEELNDIFDTLPNTGEDHDYKAAIEALNSHFCHATNSEFSIYCFRQAKQQQDESLDTYHTRLQHLATPCDFDHKDKEIKTQIIQSCTSRKLRRRALQQSDWPLKDLLDAGRAMELANKQAADIEQPLQNSDNLVNRIQDRKSQHGDRQRRDSSNRKPSGTCYFCGGSYPHTTACPAKGKSCGNCGKLNHFARVCRSKSQEKSVHQVTDSDTTSGCEHCSHAAATSRDSDDDDYVFSLNQAKTTHDDNLPTTTILVDGTSLNVLVDSGASVNILDEHDFNAIKNTPRLKRDTTTIKAYGTDTPLQLLGKFTAEVESKTNITVANFHVVSGNTGSLLSYQTARELGLIQIANTISPAPSVADTLVHKYDHLFHGIGKVKGKTVKLHIDQSIPPLAQQHRRIPFHQRKQVEEELERLQQLDIVEEVEGPTPWVSPVVVVPKPKTPTKIRLCVDMRAPNKAIRRERHITPTVDDIIAQLNGSTVFSTLDLNHGYHQLELSPESRYITTFSTHVGLRRYKRLSFGISSAAEIFQNVIREVLHNIPGALNISDDILVHGSTQEQHDESLAQVFQALDEKNITLNKEKCQFNRYSVEFFGHIFSKDGIAPDPKKVSAIKNTTAPKDKKEVSSLLGLANYCSRYIPNFATIVAPLRKLTHQDVSWHWGDEEDQSLTLLKNALCSDVVTTYYDTSQAPELIVDASPVGLGAILAQKGKVIAYASKSLNDVEQRYSQTEREALAITWGCIHFRLYLLGTKFTVITDHKPLVSIFNKPQSNPPARIANWVFKLQNYEYDVIYKEGKNNPADYISRHTAKCSTSNDKASISAECYINYLATHAVPKTLTLDAIKEATKVDSTLQAAAKLIRTQQWYNLDKLEGNIDLRALKIFKSVQHELTVSNSDDLILRNSKLVIPSRLQKQVINLAHEGHQGLVKTKGLLREKVWFPLIDELTEQLVKNCIPCQSATHQHQREPLQMTKLPDGPWQEVSVDFCDVGSHHLLVVMDDYSRYPEVHILQSTSARAVIPHLDQIFSTFGIPCQLRSDNGPPFNSEDFKNFAAYLGFNHRKVTPYWPEANGEVERFMRTLKKALRTAVCWKQELHSFLRNYRATPHSTTGVPPATALFGRPIRTRLPQSQLPEAQASPLDKETMRKKDQAAKEKMKKYADKARKASECTIQPGDTVLVQSQAKGKLKTPYDPCPLVVQKRKGSMITASNDERDITRNSSHFKLLPTQDVHEEHSSSAPSQDKCQPSSRNNDPVQPETLKRYPTRNRRPPTHYTPT